jgi:ubiquinone/menaquinone biosynthesis C-methylase UbiE
MIKAKEYYDSTYHYEEDITTGLDPKRLHHFFKKVDFHAMTDYLDIGCGAGLALEYCHQYGLRATGFDISRRAILTAKKILPKSIMLLVADGEKLPFKDRSFDLASSLGTIEHFPSPCLGIKEIVRVGKKNGTVLFIVPNSYLILNKLRVYKGTEQPQEMLATMGEWARLFKSCGMEVLTVSKDIGPKIFKNLKITGVIKRAILKITLLLPVQFAYQFVFLCRIR